LQYLILYIETFATKMLERQLCRWDGYC